MAKGQERFSWLRPNGKTAEEMGTCEAPNHKILWFSPEHSTTSSRKHRIILMGCAEKDWGFESWFFKKKQLS